MVVTAFRKKLLRFCEKVNALFQFANHTCLLFILLTYLLDSQVPDGCIVPLATNLTLEILNNQIVGQVIYIIQMITDIRKLVPGVLYYKFESKYQFVLDILLSIPINIQVCQSTLSFILQVVTTCVSAIVHSKSKCRCYYFLPMCHVTNQSGARAKLSINGEMHRLEIFFIIFVPFFCCIILKPKQCTRKIVIKYIKQPHKNNAFRFYPFLQILMSNHSELQLKKQSNKLYILVSKYFIFNS